MDTPRWAAARSARDLGVFVRQVRQEKGLSQADLADQLGLTRQYVSELETGTPTLYATRLFEIFAELGINVRLERQT